MTGGFAAATRRSSVALALGCIGLVGTAGRTGASPVVTEVRLGGVDGHFVIDVLSTESLKYAQVESGSEPFTLTFYLLDAVLAFPAVTREVNEGPLKQVTATVLQREESRVARLDLVFERLIPFRVAQDDKRLTVHLREPAIATRVVLRGTVSAAGEPVVLPEMPRAASAPPASAALPPPPALAHGAPAAATARPSGSAAPRVAGTAPGGSATSPLPTSSGTPAAPGTSPAPITPPPLPAMPSLPGSLSPTPAPATAGSSGSAAPTRAGAGSGRVAGPPPAPSLGPAPAAPGASGLPARPSGGATASVSLPGASAPPAAAPAPAPAPIPPAAALPPSIRPGPGGATALARTHTRTGAAATRITRLAHVTAPADTQVRVVADGRLSYRSFVLTGPTRLVVDFEGVAYRLTEPSLTLEGPLVGRVRAARFRSAPAEVVRVVFDLRKPAPHWVEPLDDGVIVHIGSAGPAR